MRELRQTSAGLGFGGPAEDRDCERYGLGERTACALACAAGRVTAGSQRAARVRLSGRNRLQGQRGETASMARTRSQLRYRQSGVAEDGAGAGPNYSCRRREASIDGFKSYGALERASHASASPISCAISRR